MESAFGVGDINPTLFFSPAAVALTRPPSASAIHSVYGRP
jgi:hypothetical protein